jgi:drebrin-like protein
LFALIKGEAVLDLVHKGSCANHIREITLLLKNHLTITVTNIDDLDEEVILKKLANITSTYNFENRTVHNDEKFVIGTNYSKVVPTKEIDSKRRDEFWKKEEEIEKARVATEVEAKRFANMKIEEERLKREQQEHQKREQLNKEVGTKKTILTVKEEIKAISPNKNAEKVEPPAKPRAEELRMERRKEAQELIGNKVNAAKLMFQQQAQSAGKVTVSAPQGPPAKPIRKTINKIEQDQQPNVVVAPQKEPEVVKAPSPSPPPSEQIEEQISHHDDEQFSTIKRSPRTPTSTDNQQVFIISDNGNEVEVSNYNAAEQITDKIQEKQKEEAKIPQAEEQTENDIVATEVTHQAPDFASATAGCCGDEEADQQLLKAVALYDYQAADETEISFDPG